MKHAPLPPSPVSSIEIKRIALAFFFSSPAKRRQYSAKNETCCEKFLLSFFWHSTATEREFGALTQQSVCKLIELKRHTRL